MQPMMHNPVSPANAGIDRVAAVLANPEAGLPADAGIYCYSKALTVGSRTRESIGRRGMGCGARQLFTRERGD